MKNRIRRKQHLHPIFIFLTSTIILISAFEALAVLSAPLRHILPFHFVSVITGAPVPDYSGSSTSSDSSTTSTSDSSTTTSTSDSSTSTSTSDSSTSTTSSDSSSTSTSDSSSTSSTTTSTSSSGGAQDGDPAPAIVEGTTETCKSVCYDADDGNTYTNDNPFAGPDDPGWELVDPGGEPEPGDGDGEPIPPPPSSSGCRLYISSVSGFTITFTEGSIYFHSQHLWDFQNDGVDDRITSGHSTDFTYPGAGVYTTKVTIQRLTFSGYLTVGTCYTSFRLNEPSSPPPGGGLSVILTANPNAGIAPLFVTLTAAVSGLSGVINYSFDCEQDVGADDPTDNTSYSSSSETGTSSCPYPAEGTYIPYVHVTRSGQQASDTDTVVVGAGVGSGSLIAGDIYALGRILNLTVSGPAVVSSQSGTPVVTPIGDNVYFVSNYAPRLTGAWRTVMDRNLDRIKTERGIGGFPPNLDFDGTSDRLGGGVWYGGGVSIAGPASGRGTYIAESGSIEISGNVVASKPIGLVARTGDIMIRSGVTSLQNVYLYAPYGTITFEDASTTLSANGAFIARSFSLPPRPMIIRYSTNIALNPPPGFVSFILPSVLESAP